MLNKRTTNPNTEIKFKPQNPNPNPNLITTIKSNTSNPVYLVFNYSNIQLTEAMDKLLNRGLLFSILPLKLDINELQKI